MYCIVMCFILLYYIYSDMASGGAQRAPLPGGRLMNRINNRRTAMNQRLQPETNDQYEETDYQDLMDVAHEEFMTVAIGQ